jgi:hypothetical protein
MTANRSPTGAMGTWLQNDLASTTRTGLSPLAPSALQQGVP